MRGVVEERQKRGGGEEMGDARRDNMGSRDCSEGVFEVGGDSEAGKHLREVITRNYLFPLPLGSLVNFWLHLERSGSINL
eukprot:9475881-Pyramimonas_sp.AAC.1